MTDPKQPDLPFPEQEQRPPGDTDEMAPRPHDEMRDYRGSGLLDGKVALVTGGDSGIGRAVAIAFAKEGADVAIAYLSEHDDARHTADLVEQTGRRSLLLPGDLSQEERCTDIVQRTAGELGGLDVLVNNVAMQNPVEDLAQLETKQWLDTFATNIHGYFWTTRAALRYLQRGSSIINTASVNGLRGNKSLVDYSATKGAIIAFTYALAQQQVERGIRVNCVAPGPVWTPLIPSTMGAEKAKEFGAHTMFKRPAQPDEIAPSYVFFASETLSSYYTGEVFGPTGQVLPG
ncbi:SDR family oxidoreductase [Allorhizocola rhizosphaerae]|uniref:SDR family oxidoreductase n=1 Tax=Allorhizocola rhizosphaerae TaxID=1872709 RepID=UPI000E3D7740|nr:SDR family oxidoreductase [Allorhizocola rhizosphaerae]